LKNNFTKSAIWLGFGLSFAVINLFFYYFYNYISPNILIALIFYLLIATAPLVYILGQTVPITMNLIKNPKTTGSAGGKILHLSTIGSFLGAVLTSLLLLHYLGAAWTVLINTTILVILVFLIRCFFSKNKKPEIIQNILLFGILIFVYGLNVGIEKQFFVKTNAYANYAVITEKKDKILQINNSSSSRLTPTKKGFYYIEFIKRILFEDLKLKDKNILVLGAGGFTLTAEGTSENYFTYVDIDEAIEKIVKKHFLSPIQGEFIVADAREFLNSTPKKFDVIISDVYSNQRSIPAHLLTQEYFEKIRQRLIPKGIVLLNIGARPTLEDAYSKRIDNTIRSVFHDCMAVPQKYTNEVSNVIYICKNNFQNKKRKKETYLDNLNRVDFDFFKSIID